MVNFYLICLTLSIVVNIESIDHNTLLKILKITTIIEKILKLRLTF